jgi:hypothetical protein
MSRRSAIGAANGVAVAAHSARRKGGDVGEADQRFRITSYGVEVEIVDDAVSSFAAGGGEDHAYTPG